MDCIRNHWQRDWNLLRLNWDDSIQSELKIPHQLPSWLSVREGVSPFSQVWIHESQQTLPSEDAVNPNYWRVSQSSQVCSSFTRVTWNLNSIFPLGKGSHSISWQIPRLYRQRVIPTLWGKWPWKDVFVQTNTALWIKNPEFSHFWDPTGRLLYWLRDLQPCELNITQQ